MTFSLWRRVITVFLIGGLCWVSAASAATKRKVIIDQDAFGPGGSNMQAILLVLQSPDVEVLGITIVSGDGWCAENAAHTLRLLELVGCTDVPVIAGAVYPLINSREETKRWETRYGKLFYKGAWTEGWPGGSTVKRTAYHDAHVVPKMLEGQPTTKVLNETAANFLVRKVKEFPGEVTILAMGPFTNLALAVKLDDEFAAKTKEVVFMGGSFNPRAADNEFAGEYLYSPRLEFNFRWDPEATRIMLRAPWPSIVQVPVDPTTKTLFSKALAKRATSADTPVTRYIAQYAEGYPMWDELAAAVWLKPEIITKEDKVAVDVETDAGASYGNTLSWAAGKGPGLGENDVKVVLDIDVKAFEDFCIERFNAVTAK